jgi:DNA polymerase-3 subunit delta
MSAARKGDTAVWLIRGDDAALVAQAARTVIHEAVGDSDPGLVVEELGGPGVDYLDVGVVIDACTTPPFLIDRRVIVVRDAGRFRAADAERLVPMIRELLETTVLVLVGGGGTVPAGLVKIVNELGTVIDATPRAGRDRENWVNAQMATAPVKFDAGANKLVREHLGDDLGRLEGLVGTLAAAYGEGASLGSEQVAPYLGTAGGVPTWDLTDAIDDGSTANALHALRRVMEAGARSGPEVVGILHWHFANLWRLDGADVTSGEEAAAHLGLKSAFSGKKLHAQFGRLGGERAGRALALIADADLDVKGRSALPNEVVLEILVARLSRLVRPRTASRRR